MLDEHRERTIDVDLDGTELGPRHSAIARVVVWDQDFQVWHAELVELFQLAQHGFAIGRVTVDGQPWDQMRTVLATAKARRRVVPCEIGKITVCPKCQRVFEGYYSAAGFWMSRAEAGRASVFSTEAGMLMLMHHDAFVKVGHIPHLRGVDEVEVRDE